MKTRTRNVRQIGGGLLVAAIVALSPPLPAQGEELELPEMQSLEYDYYYPSRAKGMQPTAWDVPDFDSVNLFNGNLYLSIPLGPALNAAGGVSWQPALHYNSKIWAYNTRDDFADTTNANPFHKKTSEAGGYLEAERYAGLGWSLATPYVHLRRVKRESYQRALGLENLVNGSSPKDFFHAPYATACDPDYDCVVYMIDGVVMPDGSRESLRPRREGWDLPADATDLNHWYSADGSGWMITWIDKSSADESDQSPTPNNQFDGFDVFIGIKDGLRYTFRLGFNIDTSVPANQQARETDFIADTRGWYCTRIESLRFSGPYIQFDYAPVTDPSSPEWGWSPSFQGSLDGPILVQASAYAGETDTQPVRRLKVALDTLEGDIRDPTTCTLDPAGCSNVPGATGAITVIRSATTVAVDTTGTETTLVTHTLNYQGEGDSDPPETLFALPLLGGGGTAVWWGSFSRHEDFDDHPRPPGFEEQRTRTHEYPLLSELVMTAADGTSDTYTWSFDYGWKTKWDEPDAPECTYDIIETEHCQVPCARKRLCASDSRTGLLSRVTLPNNTEVTYDYGRWYFAHHRFTPDWHHLPMPPFNQAEKTLTEDQFITGLYQDRSRSHSAGVNLRMVKDTETDEVLELTEYIHAGLDSPHVPGRPGWAFCAPFDPEETVDPSETYCDEYEQYWSYHGYMGDLSTVLDLRESEFSPPQFGFPFDFEGDATLYSSPPAASSGFFGTGFSQTTVRRHLIVDDSPPETAGPDDLDLPTGLVITTQIPDYRFDDTSYVFTNGSALYDTDDDGELWKNDDPALTDHWGTLPLGGNVLQARHYRGSASCRGEAATCDGEEFLWWKDDAAAGEPNLLRIERYQYTLEWEEWESTADRLTTQGASYPQRELCGDQLAFAGDFTDYCDSRPQNVRTRRSVTEYLAGGPKYLGSETWYETDVSFPTGFDPGLDPAEPMFADNTVLSFSLAEFSDQRPFGDTWYPSDWTLRTSTSFEKGHLDVNLEPWLPSLPSTTSTELSSDGSATEASFAYTDGVLTTKTQHAGSGGDVTATYTYWGHDGYPSSAHDLGRLRTVEIEKGGFVDAMSGFEYDHQVVSSKWSLCKKTPLRYRSDGPTGEIQPCQDWGEPPASFSLNSFTYRAQLDAEQDVDSAWRRPTSIRDGNGDGISSIEYDILGRMTHIVPTDGAKAETWFGYSDDLRESYVYIEDPSAPENLYHEHRNLVARYAFDGLGRISHAARRKEETTAGESYGSGTDFRHNVLAYDGAGTAWAESHWLAAAASPPTALTTNSNFELVAAVDPYGRVEKAVASDGGTTGTSYSGDHSLSTQVKNASSTVVARRDEDLDARGNVLKVDEAKKLSPALEWITATYAYDVAKRLTAVDVGGQTRTFTYDDLGNLTAEAHPELGPGATVTYSGHDARGNPRDTDYADGAGTHTRFQTYYDAGGRPLETWTEMNDDAGYTSWYLYSTTNYGTDAAANSIGRPMKATQYNLLNLRPAACSGGDCVADGSVRVRHDYTYGDAQGLLTGRTTSISVQPAAGEQSFSLGYTYDQWGNLATLTYPSVDGMATECSVAPGPQLTMAWDAVGLQGITDGSGVGLLSGLDYDTATGMMTTWQTPAGATTVSHAAVPDGTRARPRSLSASVGGASVFGTGDYVYDVLGNINAIGTGWSYAYDPLGRLLDATRHPGAADETVRSFTYDDFGNLKSVDGATISVDPATNRLSGSAVDYDRRGNLITEQQGAWKRQLRFDPGNRLLAAWATEDGAPVDSYAFAYDPAGERVLRYRLQDDEIHEARFFIRDEGGNVLSEFLWSPQVGPFGLWTRWDDHVYLGRRPLVRITQAEDGFGGYSSSYTTLVHDHLDSTRAEVTGGDTWTELDYWPYGEIAATGYHNTTDFSAKRLFTGHEREYTAIADDALQRMDYMHARYYSTANRRFVSIDPLIGDPGQPGSLNRYGYVRGNPLRLLDPWGLEPDDEDHDDDGPIAVFAGYIEVNASGSSDVACRPWGLQDWAEYWSRHARQVFGDIQIESDGTIPLEAQQTVHLEWLIDKALGTGAFASETPDYVLAYYMFGPQVAAGLESIQSTRGTPLDILIFGGAGGLIRSAGAKAVHTAQQQALIKLAREAKQLGGVSRGDAATLLRWGREYGLKPLHGHSRTTHWVGGPHIRVGPVKYIPVR